MIENYCKSQHLWHDENSKIKYADNLKIDLSR